MLIILLNKMVGGSWWKMTPQLSFWSTHERLVVIAIHAPSRVLLDVTCTQFEIYIQFVNSHFLFQTQKSALGSLAVGHELSFILSPCLLACRLHAEVIMRNNNKCNVPLLSCLASKSELCNPIWQSFLQYNVPPNLKDTRQINPETPCPCNYDRHPAVIPTRIRQ